mgnify:CR=1 FL=1
MRNVERARDVLRALSLFAANLRTSWTRSKEQSGILRHKSDAQRCRSASSSARRQECPRCERKERRLSAARCAFDQQPVAYKESVLPADVPRVAVEAGTSDFWRKYVGRTGAVVGIDSFGESAPAGELFKHFGFTVENVVNAVKKII